jgi:uncharacterized protein YbbC (DUF1343 family)
MPHVRTGLEILLERGSPGLSGLACGLIANHTSIDRNLRSGIDLLHASEKIELRALFGPEHGVRGDAQAGAPIQNATDARTGLPVFSLYGETEKPTSEMLAGLDALVFDIQDVGVRYGTYLSTMIAAMEVAAENGVRFAALDRPNPIGGVAIEVPLVEEGFASFVGAYPVPIRHGMTLGELARLVASERGWPEPVVVPMEGWSRSMWFDQTGLPWVQVSPNLPTLDAVTLYAGTCLFEGTTISEGRGTTRPFEYVGAPWIDAFALVERMENAKLPGYAYRPAWFTPTFSKHAGTVCGGVQVYVLDRKIARPVAMGVQLLSAMLELSGEWFDWRIGGDGRWFIDLLYGSDRLRRTIDAGADAAAAGGPSTLLRSGRDDKGGLRSGRDDDGGRSTGRDDEEMKFEERRAPFLLYSE